MAKTYCELPVWFNDFWLCRRSPLTLDLRFTVCPFPFLRRIGPQLRSCQLINPHYSTPLTYIIYPSHIAFSLPSWPTERLPKNATRRMIIPQPTDSGDFHQFIDFKIIQYFQKYLCRQFCCWISTIHFLPLSRKRSFRFDEAGGCSVGWTFTESSKLPIPQSPRDLGWDIQEP